MAMLHVNHVLISFLEIIAIVEEATVERKKTEGTEKAEESMEAEKGKVAEESTKAQKSLATEESIEAEEINEAEERIDEVKESNEVAKTNEIAEETHEVAEINAPVESNDAARNPTVYTRPVTPDHGSEGDIPARITPRTPRLDSAGPVIPLRKISKDGKIIFEDSLAVKRNSVDKPRRSPDKLPAIRCDVASSVQFHHSICWPLIDGRRSFLIKPNGSRAPDVIEHGAHAFAVAPQAQSVAVVHPETGVSLDLERTRTPLITAAVVPNVELEVTLGTFKEPPGPILSTGAAGLSHNVPGAVFAGGPLK
ncbi:hypothetical protein CONLIGDRAFT_683438 [Coniochaeta ligniaria NRRL 30616]|uniref:Uncharacterized protein n=1 Tax=Coniochaeta ligniaria NRRL 30616 TaxID=1408157 RepID=A0A1J7JFS8_9PEZI|nr:hypothetical protein CONLIGDRAFT_683438 [Coniochaeta ligniaria NRRL 30616]